MKLLWLGNSCLVGLLTAFSASGQVLWHADFESAVNFFGDSQAIQPLASFSETNIDIGAPYNHVLCLAVDASSETQAQWTAEVVFPLLNLPSVEYDPAHTFLRLDLLGSELRPINIRIEYAASGDVRDLDVAVTPASTNSFQTFLIPLCGFTNTVWVLTGTGVSGTPTALQFGISGDPAHPDTTWPSAPGDSFMMDNIAYIVSPPLSITLAGDDVLVSWPTNTTGFALQQSGDPNTANWTMVTNTPVLLGGVNQVVLPIVTGPYFYRLVGQ